MSRIVFTVAVGKQKYAETALGLGRSLKLIGDDTKRVVITDQLQFPWDRCYDQVLEPTDPIEWVYLSKLTALQRTDADQVLFIDADCLAFKRLGPIFDYCSGKGLCVQGQTITSGDWYGNVAEHLVRHQVDFLPKFNGGLMYYERTKSCQDFISQCRDIALNSPEKIFERTATKIFDEPCIALAMAQQPNAPTGTWHLIPDNANFTNSATGLVGKLSLDVLHNECHFVCRRFDVQYVEPTIFHASRFINYAVYWKQLEHLQRLEEYECNTEFGHMSGWQKLERSLNRRYLKYIKRIR